MVQISTLVVLVLCVLYTSALPTGSRVRRGFDNSGYGSDLGGGYFSQESDERDASVSHESHDRCEGCDSQENFESRETPYGRDEFNRKSGGRRPPR